MNMQKRDEQIGEMLAIEAAVTSGDLGELTPRQRVEYHTALCASVGLNPIASGFQYLKLNGKLILYPTRATTAQLAEKRGLSFELIDRQITDDDATFMVGVSDGVRSGYGIGMVPLSGLRGEARANAIMKADTKARRRGVLDFCGLGMIDESEIGSVPGARPIAVDQATGEILDNTNAGRLAAGNSPYDYVAEIIDDAAEALRGSGRIPRLANCWKRRRRIPTAKSIMPALRPGLRHCRRSRRRSLSPIASSAPNAEMR